jgi:hypothetical protein
MRSALAAVTALLLGSAAACFAVTCFDATGALAQSSANGTVIQTLPLPAPAAPGSGQGASSTGIEVGTLGDVTPDYAGTLEEGGGGFPSDMWKGTDRALVEHLLPQLPPALGSPAMRDLERRLLLTNAEAPEGKTAAGKTAGANLFAARADRLAAMGLSRDAATLLAMMPARLVDKTAARLRLDSLLLSGDIDGACKAVDDTRQIASADPYWQQTQVFCQLRAGQKDQAALGLDLLGDQGDKDSTFFKLVNALGGAKVKLDSLPEPTPLDLAMLRAAKLALPRDAARSHDPGVLAALAEDPSLDPAARLAAAEEAAATGSLAIAQLQDAYAGVTFPPGGLDDPIAASAKEAGPLGRALLYQATAAAAGNEARARLLQASLDRARHQGGYLLAVQLDTTYLLPLSPGPELAWFAGDAGRALYLAGRYEQANAWLALAQSRAASDPAAAAAASALAVYARIAGVGEPLSWDQASLEAWRQSAGGSAGAQRLLAIFEGLGEPMGGGWQMIGQGSAAGPGSAKAADPALLFNLGDAAAAHRIGETVLLSLYALGPEGPAGCNPLSLARVIAALRQIGLDSEARAIALEAAVAAGV